MANLHPAFVLLLPLPLSAAAASRGRRGGGVGLTRCSGPPINHAYGSLKKKWKNGEKKRIKTFSVLKTAHVREI